MPKIWTTGQAVSVCVSLLYRPFFLLQQLLSGPRCVGVLVAVAEFVTKLLALLERPPVDATGFYPGRPYFANRSG